MAQKRSIGEVEGVEETDRQAAIRAAPKVRRASPSTQEQSGQSMGIPSKGWSPKPVAFQKPFQLISFSYTPERQLVFDNSALKYWVQPPREADLNYRYAHWIKKKEEKGRLDGLLKAISEEPCKDARSRAQAVCWRGILCKILIAPYEERDGWTLNVMMINGTLYLEEHITNEQLAEKDAMTERHRQQTYYGYSFESWCTSTQPRQSGERAAWGGDVDTNVQWCSVVKGKIGESRILIGGEVDCVRDRYTCQPDTFMELKTSMTIRRGNASDEARFEKLVVATYSAGTETEDGRKLLKFYFQSFLLGVPEIMVGFRDFKGRLQTLQPFKTLEIPRMVRGKPDAWDPTICLAWGERFLRQVREWMERVTATGDTQIPAVGRLLFKPGQGITFKELDSAEIEEVRAGEDRIGFLPTWYMASPQGDTSTPQSRQI